MKQKKGIYDNKLELPIYRRVKTINGYTTIKYYHMITVLSAKERFYEVENLEADIIIGYSLLKKNKTIINFDKNTIVYDNKEEKIYGTNTININKTSLNKNEEIHKLNNTYLGKYPRTPDEELNTVNIKVFNLGKKNPRKPDEGKIPSIKNIRE